MDPWTRLTDLRGEGGGGSWKSLTDGHTCRARGHRQRCGEGGTRAEAGRQRWCKGVASVVVSTLKHNLRRKLKNKYKFNFINYLLYQ